MRPFHISTGHPIRPTAMAHKAVFVSALVLFSASFLVAPKAAEPSDTPALTDTNVDADLEANLEAGADATLDDEAQDPTFDEAIELVRTKDYKKAIDAFERFAEISQYDAQYNLALMLKKGIGRPQDYATALKWSWLAQLGGLKKAEYLTESLIDLLPEEAVIDIKGQVGQRLKRQAETGDAEAIMQYAHFSKEIAEPIDLEEAYTWFSIASAMQIKGGIKKRNEVAEDLDPALLLELQEDSKAIYQSIQIKLSPPPPPPVEIGASRGGFSSKFRDMKDQKAK